MPREPIVSGFEKRTAGSSPEARAASMATPAVKRSAEGSSPTLESPGMFSGAERTRTGTPTRASSTPPAPPAAASNRVSAICDRIRPARPAPSARRTARSRRRLSARTISRFATFAHAMRSTMPTVPMRIHRGVSKSPTSSSSSDRTTGRCCSMIR